MRISKRPPTLMPQRSRRTSCRGAVTVEFALVTPLLFLFVFGGIEFARLNMVRNSSESAAYHGARAGIIPGAAASDCQTAAEEALDRAGINGAEVTVLPNAIDNDTEQVTVRVEVPMAENGFVTPHFFLGPNINAEISLTRERY